MLSREFEDRPRWDLALIFFAMALMMAGMRIWFVLGTSSGGIYIDLPVVAGAIGPIIGIGMRFGPGGDRANVGLALLSIIVTLLLGIVIEYLVAYGIANHEAIALSGNPLPLVTVPQEMLKVLLLYFLSNMTALVAWMIGIGAAALVNLSYSRRHIFKQSAGK